MFKQMAVAAALVLASGSVMAQNEKATDKKPAAAAPAQPASELPTLMVGDKAPALAIGKWVKGEPVTGFEKGKTYIVEFWATWCGPCKVSIPHLTEMQKKHKDVTIIGVSVWENDQSAVEPFVKDTMGDKMAYTVAMDEIPSAEGESRAAKRAAASKGKMAKTWMEASGADGIPTAFIVNGEGKVAWIGHPMMKMEEKLETILAGKQDLAADAKKYRSEKEAEAKVKPIEMSIMKAMQEGDMDAALAKMDEIIDLNAEPSAMWAGRKYQILMMQVKDYDKAYALGNKLVDGMAKDDSQTLNTIAWFIVDPDNKPEKLDLALAEKAAKRACEITKMKDGMLVDTLAAVYFAKKDYAKAIEFQDKAVKLVADMDNVDPRMVDEMKDRLEQFKKAAAGGGS